MDVSEKHMSFSMSDKEKIENCYWQMYLGMVEKDRGILSEVLDDSFVLVHMTGMRQCSEEDHIHGDYS